MKSNTVVLLFWSLVLVHLAAQFAVLYVWVHVVDLDPVQYDAAKDFYWRHYLFMVTIPGGIIINALPEPRTQWVGWVQTTVIFVFNSVLWSGIICAISVLCFRLFRPRSSLLS